MLELVDVIEAVAELWINVARYEQPEVIVQPERLERELCRLTEAADREQILAFTVHAYSIGSAQRGESRRERMGFAHGACIVLPVVSCARNASARKGELIALRDHALALELGGARALQHATQTPERGAPVRNQDREQGQ